MSKRMTFLLPSLLLACGPKTTEVESSADAQVAEENTLAGDMTPPPPEETEEEKQARIQIELERAIELIRSPEIVSVEQGLSELNKLQEDLSDSPFLHFNKGVALHKLRRWADATEAYERSLQLKPDFHQARLNVAHIAWELGEDQRVLSIYQQGIDLDREFMDYWVGWTGALYRLGQLEQAESVAKNGLKVNSNTLDLYSNLSLIFIDQEKYSKAEFIIKKAIDSVVGGDKHPRLKAHQGLVFLGREMPDNAEIEFKAALEMDPDLVSTRVHLSNLYLDKRNYEDSRSLLERARELEMENHGVHMNLGIAYRGLGSEAQLIGDAEKATEYFEKAQQSFEKVLELDSGAVDPYLNLGILYGDYTKDYDKAVEAYNQYKTAGGTEVELVDGYIDATVKEQERAKRLEDRRKKLEEMRKKKEAQKKLLEEQRAKEAAEEAARAAEEAEKPDDPWSEGEGSDAGGEAPADGAAPAEGSDAGGEAPADGPAPAEGSDAGGEAPAESADNGGEAPAEGSDAGGEAPVEDAAPAEGADAGGEAPAEGADAGGEAPADGAAPAEGADAGGEAPAEGADAGGEAPAEGGDAGGENNDEDPWGEQ